MNIYTYQFKLKCPVNDLVIKYNLKIKSSEIIRIEDIVSFLAEYEKGFHEDVANKLFDQFAGYQIMKAFHHGVHIETRRGVSI